MLEVCFVHCLELNLEKYNFLATSLKWTLKLICTVLIFDSVVLILNFSFEEMKWTNFSIQIELMRGAFDQKHCITWSLHDRKGLVMISRRVGIHVPKLLKFSKRVLLKTIDVLYTCKGFGLIVRPVSCLHNLQLLIRNFHTYLCLPFSLSPLEVSSSCCGLAKFSCLPFKPKVSESEMVLS